MFLLLTTVCVTECTWWCQAAAVGAFSKDQGKKFLRADGN